VILQNWDGAAISPAAQILSSFSLQSSEAGALSIANLRNASTIFSINGSEAVRFKPVGGQPYFGVNTPNPATMAHITGAGSTPRYRAQSSDSGGVVIELTANAALAGAVSVNTAHPLIFQTQSAERMRLDTLFNVMMNGITAAATGANGCFHIGNAASVPSASVAGGIIYVQAGALKYRGSSGTVTTLAAA
jgi:hypothetical protein